MEPTNTNDRKRAMTTAAIATALPLGAEPVNRGAVLALLLDIDSALLTDLHRVTCALAALPTDGKPAAPRSRSEASVRDSLKRIETILRGVRTQIADVEARL